MGKIWRKGRRKGRIEEPAHGAPVCGAQKFECCCVGDKELLTRFK